MGSLIWFLHRAAPRSCSGKGLVILPSSPACVSSLRLANGAGGQSQSPVSQSCDEGGLELQSQSLGFLIFFCFPPRRAHPRTFITFFSLKSMRYQDDEMQPRLE